MSSKERVDESRNVLSTARRIAWATVGGVAAGLILSPVLAAVVSLVFGPGPSIGGGVFAAVLFSVGVAFSMTVVWVPVLVALLVLQTATEPRWPFLGTMRGILATATVVAASLAIAVRTSPTPEPAATSVALTWIVIVVGLFEGAEARRGKKS